MDIMFFKWCTAPYPPSNWTWFISILSPCVWCSYLFHLVRTLHPTANNYLGSKQIGGGLVWWLDTLTNNVLLKCNCLPCHIYIHTNNCDLLKIVTSTNLLIYCLVTVTVAAAVAVNVNAFLLLIYTSWPWCHLSLRMLLNTTCSMSNMKKLLHRDIEKSQRIKLLVLRLKDTYTN